MLKLKNVGRVISVCIGLTGLTNALAGQPVIVHQKEIVANLRQHSNLQPIIFPQKIPPAAVTPLYMSMSGAGSQPDYNQFWQLNVDATPECHGVHVCNIGFISAEKNGKLAPNYYSLPDQKHLKQTIQLQHHITGYYTPFHVQASGVNPTLEWKINHVLFTLSWQIQASPAQQKRILTTMANSAIANDPR